MEHALNDATHTVAKPTEHVNQSEGVDAPNSVTLRKELRASAEAVRTHIRGGFIHADRELLRVRP